MPMKEGYHAQSYLFAPGSTKAVIFIHGFMGSPRQFDRLAGAVHKRGFNAVILLLPGHGRSSRDFSLSTAEIWQKYVQDEIERLSAKFTDIWLVGHSMGGLLALGAAAKPHKALRGVMTIASPFKLTALSRKDIKIRLITVLASDENKIKSEYMGKNSVPVTSKIFLHTLGPMVQVSLLMRSTRAKLPSITLPVVSAYSKGDELVSFRSLEIIRSEISAIPFEEVVLERSLHAFYTEKEKVILEEALIEFLG
ncbi:MAG: alpha/beta fold hydrolase [Oscillospiraceae bacterium]|nr:alpha/beta fold hydrolase [Oscillospiraceae bacterium]